MLSMPIMSSRIGKWILALSEVDLRYESAKEVKGQIMADFVTQHCGVVDALEIVPWTLFFDGSTCGRRAGIGIVLISPRGKKYEYSLTIVATSTNNQAEYQASIKGLELLKEVHADVVLIACYEKCVQLLKEFRDFQLEHIPWLQNEEANWLAQHASGYQPIQEVLSTVGADDWRK